MASVSHAGSHSQQLKLRELIDQSRKLTHSTTATVASDPNTLERAFHSTAESFVDILRAKEREKRHLVREERKRNEGTIASLKEENRSLREENEFLLRELSSVRRENAEMRQTLDGLTNECAGSMELLADVMQDCIAVTTRSAIADA